MCCVLEVYARYNPDVRGRGGSVSQTADVGRGGASKKSVFGLTSLMDDAPSDLLFISRYTDKTTSTLYIYLNVSFVVYIYIVGCE